jgi:phosphate/sulfate permease
VSTTHSIVGAIIGMTLVAVGPSAVLWSSSSDTFPYIGGVASLCASWITSPILGALLSCFCFWLLRTLVLRHDNAYQRAFYVLPLVVFLVAWFITIFTIKESTYRWDLHHMSYGTASWIGAIVGAVATGIAIAWQIYHVRRLVDADLKAAEELDMAAKAAGFDLPAPASLPRRAGAVAPHGSIDPSESASPPMSVGTGPEGDEASQAEAAGMTPEAFRAWRKSRMWAAVTYQANMDIHEVRAGHAALRCAALCMACCAVLGWTRWVVAHGWPGSGMQRCPSVMLAS